MGDPDLARIELHAAPQRLLREYVDRQPRRSLIRYVFGDAALEIRHLLPEAWLAPHLVGPAGVNHDNRVGADLDSAFGDVLHRHHRVRPLPGKLISTPSLTNCETGIWSIGIPFSTMWRGASIW